MIKIISGWSSHGGSTTSFINLTNLFNKNNLNCCFFGPHEYHIRKCNGKLFKDFTINNSDHIIVHFLDIKQRPPIDGQFLYYCHETNLKPVSSFNYHIFDSIIFVSNKQKEWHNIKDKVTFVIPNVIDDLKAKKDKKFNHIAAIIGSIDRNKQVHKSVLKALKDNMNEVRIYGNVTDHEYYEREVKYLYEKYFPKIKMMGYQENKQKIYDEVTDVYQDSLCESFGLVYQECLKTGIKYHGNGVVESNFENFKLMNEEAILQQWKKILTF